MIFQEQVVLTKHKIRFCDPHKNCLCYKMLCYGLTLELSFVCHICFKQKGDIVRIFLSGFFCLTVL